MTHDAHQGDGTLLHDGCPRCQEMAEAPWFHLDDVRREQLLAMALAWEYGGDGPEPAGELERAACQRIINTLNATRALFGLGSNLTVIERLR